MTKCVLATLLVLGLALPLVAAPTLRVTWSADDPVARLYWNSVNGATQYRVSRASVYPSFSTILVVTTTSFNESPAANAAYVYQVQPLDGQSVPVGAASNAALVTTYSFTTPTLTPLTTRSAATHFTELRSAVNAAQVAAHVTPTTWSRSITSTTHLGPGDVTELRTALDSAIAGIGLQSPSYVDSTIGSTTPFRAIHVQQLRRRVQAFPEYLSSSLSVSNRYFSPNGDGQKDTTTFSGSLSGVASTQWQINIRNSVGTLVGSSVGMGTAVSYTWGGSGQPEGDYVAEIVDLDSITAPLTANALTTIDLTPPAVAIASPTAGQLVSNVRLSGSGDFTVTGSATDSHFATWTLDRTGNGQPSSNIAAAAPPSRQPALWAPGTRFPRERSRTAATRSGFRRPTRRATPPARPWTPPLPTSRRRRT